MPTSLQPFGTIQYWPMLKDRDRDRKYKDDFHEHACTS